MPEAAPCGASSDILIAKGKLFLSLHFLADQVVCHHFPVGKTFGTKLYPLTGKLTRTMLCPVVNQIIAIDKVLAMRQDNTFLEEVAKVMGEPLDLVGPCRRIVPGSRGEDIDLVVFTQLVRSINGAGHRIHQRENAGHLVKAPLILALCFFTQLFDFVLKINLHTIHVEKQRFHSKIFITEKLIFRHNIRNEEDKIQR